MTCFCSSAKVAGEHYYVVLMDYRTAGQEAIVDPKIDRAEVIARLKTREYKDVVFIHEIRDGIVEDVTLQLISEARGLVFA